MSIKKMAKTLEDLDHSINNILKEPFATKTTTIISFFHLINLSSRRNLQLPKKGCHAPVTLIQDKTHYKAKNYKN